MGSARLGGYWHAVTVELGDDEFVPYRGYIHLRGMPAWGEMFLTTKRLIWIRARFALPIGRKLLVVPLNEIESSSIEPVSWWWLEWLGRRRRTLRIRTTSDTYDFVTAWSREDADDWAEALANVIAGAGIALRKAQA